MINKHKSNKIKENSNTVRHLNNGTDHRHSKSCCDQSSPARRTMKATTCHCQVHQMDVSWRGRLPWWRHEMETFFALLALCAGNSPVPVNSPHKGQWHGTLMFSLICHRINGWVNNREAGDPRRRQAHYDVIVMQLANWKQNGCSHTL